MFRFALSSSDPSLLPQPQAAGDGLASGVQEPSGPDLPHQSPLTFGKVYLALPRVTGVNTPNINSKIAEKWGLPCVKNSEEFRKNYVEGRDVLRCI